jgi:hypothetical protein
METKKLSQEELQQIQDIQSKNQAITMEFGQIELVKMNLKERKDNAVAFLQELRQEETALAKSLEEAYGKGSIDLEKGEFIPLEAEVTEEVE